MKNKLQYFPLILSLITILAPCVSAFTAPPHITVDKPIPSRTFIIDASGGGDYTNFEDAEKDAMPGDKYIIKSGTYPHFFWSKSGSSGKEIVFEAAGNGPAEIKGAILNEVPAFITGDWIIIDGGYDKDIIFNGANNQISRSEAVLYLTGSYITVSRVKVINNGSSEGETILKGSNNNIYNSVYYGSEGEGIYIRDGNTFKIHNNVFYRNKSGGLQINPHTSGENVNDVSICGNVFYDNGYSAIDGDRGGITLFIGSSGHTLSNVHILNNLIFNNNVWGIKLDQVSGAIMTDIHIYNNTIYSNDSYGLWTKVSNVGSIMNNIVCNNSNGDQYYQIAETGGGTFKEINNNITSKPDFISTNPDDNDYLRISSLANSAIDKGANLEGFLNNDFFGNLRNDGKFDIGANELLNGDNNIINSPINLRIASQ